MNVKAEIDVKPASFLYVAGSLFVGLIVAGLIIGASIKAGLTR